MAVMVEAQDFVSTLGEWRRRPGPAYRRLASAIREAIDGGRFPIGSKIPPERELAEAVGVSRTTVVGAYGELREEGWLESVQGSGTRTARSGSIAAPAAAEAVRRRNTAFRGLIDSSGTKVAFLGLHLPAVAPDFEEAMEETAKDSKTILRGHGYTGLGSAPLREAIAAHLTAGGLPTRAAEVMVTHGAQQAIGLAASLLLHPGDAILLEDPTYLGAIDLFGASGARIVPIPVGREGLRIERFAAAISREHPRAAYLMPSFQNPVGAVLAAESRREIAALAEKHGVALIEDGTLDDLDAGAPPPPPIGAFARGATVITIGSLSKLIWGGLRVGWFRAPQHVVDAAAGLKVMSDLGNSPISQAVAVRLMRRLRDIRERRRLEVAERYEALASELSHALPEWEWERPAGGLSLWVRLPRGNADDFAELAARHGVAILPGSTCSPTNGSAEYLRLPFCLSPDEIRDGIRRLARAWREYAPAHPAAGESRRRMHVVV